MKTHLRGLNRALPTWAVNVLHNGVRGRNPDPRTVFGKFVSIAMSARIRGWSGIQFSDEMWSQEMRLIKGSRTYGHWALTTQLITGAKGNSSGPTDRSTKPGWWPETISSPRERSRPRANISTRLLRMPTHGWNIWTGTARERPGEW